MKKIFSDSIVEAASKIMLATLPLMMLSHFIGSTMFVAMVAVGAIALAVFVGRIIVVLSSKKTIESNKLEKCVNSVLSLPYVMLLSTMIAHEHGVEVEYGYLVAAVFAVLSIAASLIGKK